jgi:hypothetical protein
MKAACAFPDWNPTSFLCPAEMMNALAIGYDWLYNYMQPQDKSVIESAIYNKGFHFAIEYYTKNYTEDPVLKGTFDWTVVNYNWNPVCNGGTLVAALALWEVFPDVTSQIFKYALNSLPLALVNYGPDGGWLEGPMYATYATEYLSYLLGALESSFGTDFGLLETHPL